MYPSPSLLSKNQLAQEGPDSVAPVVKPALAPALDRSLRSDRSLFPVRALRSSLERASDLGQNKEVVLSPLGKVSTKTPHLPLSPLGSSRLWSYVMSFLTRRPTLYIRLKAHDVRAFAAPKVFQSGVSLDPFLSACHWSHIIPSHSAFEGCGLGWLRALPIGLGAGLLSRTTSGP